MFGFPTDCRHARARQAARGPVPGLERDDEGPKVKGGGCSVSGDGDQTLNIL